MEILEVNESDADFVETASGIYVRFTASSWFKRMGEALEPISADRELEAAYQEYRFGRGLDREEKPAGKINFVAPNFNPLIKAMANAVKKTNNK